MSKVSKFFGTLALGTALLTSPACSKEDGFPGDKADGDPYPACGITLQPGSCSTSGNAATTAFNVLIDDPKHCDPTLPRSFRFETIGGNATGMEITGNNFFAQHGDIKRLTTQQLHDALKNGKLTFFYDPNNPQASSLRIITSDPSTGETIDTDIINTSCVPVTIPPQPCETKVVATCHSTPGSDLDGNGSSDRHDGKATFTLNFCEDMGMVQMCICGTTGFSFKPGSKVHVVLRKNDGSIYRQGDVDPKHAVFIDSKYLQQSIEVSYRADPTGPIINNPNQQLTATFTPFGKPSFNGTTTITDQNCDN